MIFIVKVDDVISGYINSSREDAQAHIEKVASEMEESWKVKKPYKVYQRTLVHSDINGAPHSAKIEIAGYTPGILINGATRVMSTISFFEVLPINTISNINLPAPVNIAPKECAILETPTNITSLDDLAVACNAPPTAECEALPQEACSALPQEACSGVKLGPVGAVSTVSLDSLAISADTAGEATSNDTVDAEKCEDELVISSRSENTLSENTLSENTLSECVQSTPTKCEALTLTPLAKQMSDITTPVHCEPIEFKRTFNFEEEDERSHPSPVMIRAPHRNLQKRPRARTSHPPQQIEEINFYTSFYRKPPAFLNYLL